MKNILKLVFLASILFIFSCSSSDDATCNDGIQNGNETEIDCGGDCNTCALGLEGIYDGLLRIRDFNDMDEILFESANATVAISLCSNNCVELIFQADGGGTTAAGTYTRENGFFSLDLPPIYEVEGEIQTWEEDYPQGTGTFDYANNELLINLTVSDENSIATTESAYYFEGSQN